MASAGRVDLIVQQGTTFTHSFNWNDQNGDPVDLTGATAYMQLRNTKTSQEVVLDLQSNGYISISNASTGEVSITIPPSVTESSLPPVCVYDVKIMFTNGNVFKIVEGDITLERSVTRITV